LKPLLPSTDDADLAPTQNPVATGNGEIVFDEDIIKAALSLVGFARSFYTGNDADSRLLNDAPEVYLFYSSVFSVKRILPNPPFDTGKILAQEEGIDMNHILVARE
tara:strand:+ start:99 stop:416 length:318 start_codon:yes stop_codon:yes gene_type:complete